MLLEPALAAAALVLALATRPWRQLASGPQDLDGRRRAPALLTPLLVTLVVLPWMWALPTLHSMPLQLQWSGACLVVLVLGWPLACWRSGPASRCPVWAASCRWWRAG